MTTRDPGVRLTIEQVLDAWGLVDPLRFAVRLLLDFGSKSFALDGAMMLVNATREHDRSKRTMRDSDLQASDVAQAFGLDPHLRRVLVHLRWAGLAGTPAERNGHLDNAAEDLATAIRATRRLPDVRAVANDNGCQSTALETV